MMASNPAVRRMRYNAEARESVESVEGLDLPMSAKGDAGGARSAMGSGLTRREGRPYDGVARLAALVSLQFLLKFEWELIVGTMLGALVVYRGERPTPRYSTLSMDGS